MAVHCPPSSRLWRACSLARRSFSEGGCKTGTVTQSKFGKAPDQRRARRCAQGGASVARDKRETWRIRDQQPGRDWAAHTLRVSARPRLELEIADDRPLEYPSELFERESIAKTASGCSICRQIHEIALDDYRVGMVRPKLFREYLQSFTKILPRYLLLATVAPSGAEVIQARGDLGMCFTE